MSGAPVLALFALLAAAAFVSGVVAVTRKEPVYAVLGLLPMFLALAGIFVLLSAPFVAALEVILYAGAIVVLFLFVLMMISRGPTGTEPALDRRLRVGLVAAWAGLLFLLAGGALLLGGSPGPRALDSREALEGFGSLAELARAHFGPAAGGGVSAYLVPFELVSVLLVAAILGAVVLLWRGRGERSASPGPAGPAEAPSFDPRPVPPETTERKEGA